MKFSVVAGDFKINIEKFGDESYKFSIHHEYLEWTGSSRLRHLSYVENFGEYLTNNPITATRLFDSILVSLPLPRLKSNEVVQLTKPKSEMILVLQKRIKSLELELQNYVFPKCKTIPVMVDKPLARSSKRKERILCDLCYKSESYQ